MANDPYRLVGAEPSPHPKPTEIPRKRRTAASTSTSAYRRREPRVPESWGRGFVLDENDPKQREHYRVARFLRWALTQKFNIYPEFFYPTKDLRGAVKLTFPEVYLLVYAADDQPPLICNGQTDMVTGKGRQRITADFSDPLSKRHQQEVQEMREVLAEEFGIFPRSVVPTRDFRGRVELTFAELIKILTEALDIDEATEQQEREDAGGN